MKNRYKIWLSPPHICGKEMDYIQDAFAKNWIAPLGDNIAGFENDIQAFLEENIYVTALNTGTSAIHLAMVLLGVQRDDWVICQDLTFIASINPAIYLGAKPVFVGSEKETWNMSPEFLEEAIVSCIRKGKKPKLIVWVNLYGMPAKISEIKAIADKYEIPLLEDAAESLGSEYYGRKCGTFGDISIVSFNGNKIITTSNGGALLSSKKTYTDKARFLASQARDSVSHYQHSEVGYNYALSNISAGIGRGQMTAIQDRIIARRKIHAFYKQAFDGIDGIKLHNEPNDLFFSNHWLSCILVDPVVTGGADRERVRLSLQKSLIESRPLWNPMHLQLVFKDCDYYGDNISEDLFNTGLCLPSGSNLIQNELEEIVEIVTKCVCL